jgi:tetratricopeptide (TPR) repeat protein
MMRLAILTLLPAMLVAQTPEQLFEQRKYDEARTAFQAQLARDKNDANALYYLGRIAEAQDKFGEAVEWFEKAVKRNDASALYHLWLGNALGDQAQRANKLRQPFLARRVKSEFERAVQLDPTMLDAREGLVNFYSIAPGVMGGSMEKAKEQAAEMVKLNPIRGHLAVARVAQRQKDIAAEEAAYQAALRAAPDSGQPYYSLAAFYRRQSKWTEAFATYEALKKARPDDMIAHAGWGITAAQSGTNLERGERELKHFLENLPKDMSPITTSAVHFRLGQIYERTARREQAQAAYAEAVKLNPQNQDAKKALAALK